MSGVMNPVGTSHLDGGILRTERLLVPSGVWSLSGAEFRQCPRGPFPEITHLLTLISCDGSNRS